MGYVYAGQGSESKHFKFGRTTGELGKRRSQHRTSDPSFEVYRFFQTTNPNAAEKFLKKRFAERRVPNTKEWFAVDREEVDRGFSALSVYMEAHLSVSEEKEVEAFSKEKSDGVYLAREDHHRAIYETLRKLKIEIEIRKLEFEHLTGQLNLQIGHHDGIEGLFTWISEQRHQLDQEFLKENYSEVWSACRRENFVRKFRLLDEEEGEEDS
jgi:Meiotically Up-regulated Gene 113 (MUG113) protein